MFDHIIQIFLHVFKNKKEFVSLPTDFTQTNNISMLQLLQGLKDKQSYFSAVQSIVQHTLTSRRFTHSSHEVYSFFILKKHKQIANKNVFTLWIAKLFYNGAAGGRVRGGGGDSVVPFNS